MARSSGQGVLSFRTGGTASSNQAMLIDNSQNVLINKTSASFSTEGHEFRKGSAAIFGRDGGEPLVLNRITSEGGILRFNKDNGLVGSVSVANGDLNIDGDTGIRFQDSSIIPRRAGSDVDATVDMGLASHRWKDLYLSGGVHLGGTGAANKLDDYEEGTWTPTIFGGTTAGTYALETARTKGVYTKVGNVVTIVAVLRITATTSAGAGTLNFGGLPFGFGPNIAPAWGQGAGIRVEHYGAGSNSSASTYPPPFIGIGNGVNNTTFSVQSYGKNYQVTSNIQDLSADNWIYTISGSYQTST
jgi:hypothetical protein